MTQDSGHGLKNVSTMAFVEKLNHHYGVAKNVTKRRLATVTLTTKETNKAFS